MLSAHILRSPAFFICLLLFFIAPATAGAQRITISANSDWKFRQGRIVNPGVLPAAGWQAVTLPHSWNRFDTQDDEPGYYRGEGWYTRRIIFPPGWKEKEIFLEFGGANQVTEVFLNGKKVGEHTGGYTAFNINITSAVIFGPAGNGLTVKVNNSHQPDVPPLSADFTFFGGIYREVHIVATEKIHFERDQYGSRGIVITTPVVSAETGEVHVEGTLTNSGPAERKVSVRASVYYRDSLVSATATTLIAKQRSSFTIDLPAVKNPGLWSPADPELYVVRTTIIDAVTGIVKDELSSPLGFRWFRFDAEKGFFLNGEPLKLIGASRHQDYQDIANAVPAELALRDVELLKEMGGNFLRVAHYPQDQVVLDACDRLGILASVEIPIVNAIIETPAFSANCLNMQTEMIRQNRHHPSVVVWTYMNEVLLRPPFATDSLRRETYFRNVAALAQRLEDLTRKEDPTRYTMIPNHGNFALYHRVGLTRIPMIVGWNLYQGWYSGKLAGFADFLDKHHRELGDKPLLVTEYGADVDSRIHSDHPVRFDKSVEYGLTYHQVYLKAMMDRPFVAAGIAWNLADFNSEERGESDPHINNKGLLTIGRKPKDTYYFYQANLLKVPFLKIGLGGRSFLSGEANGEGILIQRVRVYSNQPIVSLFLNGKKLAEQRPVQGVATFEAGFRAGNNVLLARAGEGDALTDQYVVEAMPVPGQLSAITSGFPALNMCLGDPRHFTQENGRQVWLPEQPYKKGSWGYVGGRRFTMKDTTRLSFGTNEAIANTDLDPVYQTQRVGIEQFIASVPAGQYELTLHFAELLSAGPAKVLAYDLGAKSAAKDEFKGRMFDVQVNGVTVLEGIGAELTAADAVSYKIPVSVNNKEGLVVTFVPRKGETILNAIQIRKIY
ncbi:glycoside hydrolase family 2 TIM barrel-domain containing protein [Hufsiella ginkgonis]|uniref:Beta-galactosidase n=1 Tax=Hufsiella ginkgonis TaxID=2695274 RepID=A0A7K1XYG0_9SPHI|nr:glycoside hydrolase family 2 TIM barrel-domain containing protein [Hufsiella ginkgonis]MXV15779.1 beta-galactosidase [Hufsiella ginkgonis]